MNCRERGRKKERERYINVWLLPACSLLGTWPATQASALTTNQNGDPLVCRQALTPLSHTSQGQPIFFFNQPIPPHIPHFFLVPQTLCLLNPQTFVFAVPSTGNSQVPGVLVPSLTISSKRTASRASVSPCPDFTPSQYLQKMCGLCIVCFFQHMWG